MKQLSLFEDSDRSLPRSPEPLVMDRDALIRWKQRIFEYQQSVREQKQVLREWERELIYRWRSPFNKECVQWYGKPFGKEVFIDGK